MKPTKIKDFRGSEEQSSSEQKKEIEEGNYIKCVNGVYHPFARHTCSRCLELQKQREEIIQKLDEYWIQNCGNRGLILSHKDYLILIQKLKERKE